jgi:hypothetical protein
MCARTKHIARFADTPVPRGLSKPRRRGIFSSPLCSINRYPRSDHRAAFADLPARINVNRSLIYLATNDGDGMAPASGGLVGVPARERRHSLVFGGVGHQYQCANLLTMVVRCIIVPTPPLPAAR